jgi:hypothetical protein
MLVLIAGGVGVVAGATGGAAIGAEPTRSITIYSSAQPGAVNPAMYRPVRSGGYNPYGQQAVPGYAVVREDRGVTIAQGRGELKITDVAALIDPTTVAFTSITDPEGTRVVDQNFQFDLVSNDKLLERFVDQEIGVIVQRGDTAGTVKGTLLSAQGGVLILRDAGGGLNTLNGYLGLDLPELPSGLITRPTLVWNTTSTRGGEQTARISYQTEGITWWADYNLVFAEGKDANAGTLDVGAWVSILNQSGATYDNTRLKLVAGDVQRAQQAGVEHLGFAQSRSLAGDAAAPSFAEKSFFEYHLYTLSEPTTIPQNSTKQIELFPTARGVPCDKILVYAGQGDYWWGGEPITDQGYGVQSKSSVDVYLKFKNDEKQGLGMPLPAGRIRVSKLDPEDGGLEFIGEDVIKHTPREEQVLIRLGQAFDVVGERKQTDFRFDAGRRRMDETIEIEVRNRKKEAVQVIVQERMYRWTNWEFVGSPPAHEKLDARTIHIPVNIEPNGTTTVKYTVRYTW